MDSVFLEISIVVVVATACATIAKLLRQPTIPAYILAGVLLGPPVFNIIKNGQLLTTVSTFGIAFLLFLVGIELDLKKFIKTSRAAILVGVLQMVFATGGGYLLIRLLGFTNAAAFFLALALGFSSTIIVLKILGEQKELNTLHGQILIGILLTQDFIAILFLMFFNVWAQSSPDSNVILDILLIIIKGSFLFGLAFAAARYLLTTLFSYFARQRELLFLGAISWCLIFTMLARWLDFSVEIGALLAGVSLSFVPYSTEIAYRVRTLRDFFLPIFFALLGAELIFPSGMSVGIPAFMLSLFVLLGSPLIVILALLWLGYRARTSFEAGVTLGQVSEFSFVLVSVGWQAGVLHQSIVSLVALIGLVTMTISTYMMEYDYNLYLICRPLLKKLENRRLATKLHQVPPQLHDHVVLIGYHTMGYQVRMVLEKLHMPYVIIDYNPDVIRRLAKENIPHVYGNMSDNEVLELANIAQAKYIISTAPTPKGTLGLLEYLKINKTLAQKVVTALSPQDALNYYEQGASFVLFPVTVSTTFLSQLLRKNIDKAHQEKHVAELRLLQSLETI